MKTVFSPLHAGHADTFELVAGELVPGFEKPSRAEFIRARVESEKLGDILPPQEHDLSAARKVHASDYIDFLPTVWSQWQAAGHTGPVALPYVWPTRGLRADRRPSAIEAQLGYYSFDGGAPFVKGTWEAVRSSCNVALTAAGLVDRGERAAFALCRPPGHHAGSAFMGGYCYINNAAVAAQWFRDHGAARVSVLDIDYHHGNGTQEIFYSRADVQVLNLHADPMAEYPFFLGHADEHGMGAGQGCNHNYPMPAGTAWDEWSLALEDACAKIGACRPDVVVVSLGVDTFEKDPISGFRLKSSDYPLIGKRIRKLGLPVLFIMEGGYAVEEIGINAVGVLTGFEGR